MARFPVSDPVSGLAHALSHPFMQNALLAGTAVALLCGAVGYFVVLRSQVFAGDALSHLAYTGSLAALAAGFDLRLGLFTATIGGGIALNALGGRANADDTVIGTAFAWILGLGVFFLALYTTHASSANGTANVRVLFGSIFGIDAAAAVTAAVVAGVALLLLLFVARPLLFASIDPAVAAARRVRVRILGALFLAIVGTTAAEAAQLVGALLLLGLLAAPAGAAYRLTARPWRAMALSAGFAVTAVWAGLIAAYAIPALPASFTIVSCAALEYIAAGVVGSRRVGRPDRIPA
jgi:zinc/manganese transport system permease protein